MSPRSISEFDDDEFGQFAKLIEQPSFSPPGEFKMAHLVEKMYASRRAKAMEALSQSIYGKNGGNASKADDQAERQLLHDVQSVPASEPIYDRAGDSLVQLKSLVIMRGDPETARYHVMVPSHYDTVEPSSDVMRTLTRDSKNADRLRGIGAWDMKAGVYNSIALAAEIVLPPELCAHFVFTPDEERHSRGARGLDARWSYREQIMAVLSQEIGPLAAKPDDDDMRPRVVLGRPGRQKFEIEVTLSQSEQGHFASASNRYNAKDICDELSIELRKRSAAREGKRKAHPLLGPAVWESGEGGVMRSRMDRWPDHGTFDFAVHARPGVSFSQQMADLRADVEAIRKEKGWTAQVTIDLRPYSRGVSYEPFFMPITPNGEPQSHRFTDVVFRGVKQATGYDPVPAAGLSVADENLYSAWMLKRLGLYSFEGVPGGVISVPPRGNKAHNQGEWVSGRSILETRAIFRWLLEDPHGLCKLAPKAKRRR